MRRSLKELGESVLAELVLDILAWKIKLAFIMGVAVILAVAAAIVHILGWADGGKMRIYQIC